MQMPVWYLEGEDIIHPTTKTRAVALAKLIYDFIFIISEGNII